MTIRASPDGGQDARSLLTLVPAYAMARFTQTAQHQAGLHAVAHMQKDSILGVDGPVQLSELRHLISRDGFTLASVLLVTVL